MTAAAAATPFLQSAGGASAISAGASILGSAFGGDSYGRQKRLMRKQYKYQLRYNPAIIKSNMLATVEGAKAAGIHPLVAMGASGLGGQPVSIPGQSDGGSPTSNAMRAISDHFNRMSAIKAQTDLIEAQASASRARALEASVESTNEKAPSLEARLRDIHPGLTSEESPNKGAGLIAVEPSIQRTRNKQDSSRSAGSNPAWMQVELWPGFFADVPWSEEGFAESMDNLPALAATIARNAGIGFQKAFQSLKKAHRKYFTSRQANMRSRHPAKYRYSDRKKITSDLKPYRRRGYAGPQPYRPTGWRN